MEGEDDFGARLTLAMKLLNLSNGAVASEARADKSLVSRWTRGLATPRGPYRAVLTQIVRVRVPGFTQMSWDLPRDQFARLLGGEEPSAFAPAAPVEPQFSPQAPATAAAPTPARKRSTIRRWWRYGLAAVAVSVAAVFAIVTVLTHRSSQTAAASSPSIAVMPFDNLSGDPAKAYFSDGVSEQLLDELANVPGLRVASRIDSFALRNRSLDAREIADRLHVATLLQGSVREDGRRVRITAQLINASSGFPIWSQSYDRELTDVLKLQSEIGLAITGALSQRLLAGAGRPTPPRIEPEVYREYLQALGDFYSSDAGDHERSVALLRDVTTRAPDFADGFGQLGMSMNALFELDRTLPITKATGEAFARALQLDPTNRRALGGYPLFLFNQWRWQEAADAAFRAGRYADDTGKRALANMYYMLDLPGPNAAMERRLVASRPTDFWQYNFLSEALYRLGRYAEAMEMGHQEELLQGGDWALADQCAPATMLGDTARARSLEQRLKPPSGGDVSAASAYCTKAIAVRLHDLPTLRALADALAGRFPHTSEVGAQQIGDLYQQVGDYDRAMQWFNRAFERREPTLFAQMNGPSDQSTPEARGMADDLRWRALVLRPAGVTWQKVRASVAARPIPPG